jgi:hypothetical protein
MRPFDAVHRQRQPSVPLYISHLSPLLAKQLAISLSPIGVDEKALGDSQNMLHELAAICRRWKSDFRLH